MACYLCCANRLAVLKVENVEKMLDILGSGKKERVHVAIDCYFCVG